MGSVKRLLLLLSLSLLAMGLFVPLAWGENTVTFADPNLEAAVREQLGMPTGDITVDLMQGFTSLDASEREIEYLSGLEYATNLNYLNLNGNFISDISALQGLTCLQELDLRYNNIEDISQFVYNSNLGSATLIRLGGNQLNLATNSPDRQAISQLVYKEVQVSYVFPDLALEAAILGHFDCYINDLTPEYISEYLTDLNAAERDIKDLSGLENALSLRDLNLNCNQIHDIWLLHNCTNLETLELANNQIEDISALSFCINLTSLNLANNQISDIYALSYYSPNNLFGLVALNYLNLSNNKIEDIFALINCPALAELDLSNNEISEIFILLNLDHLSEVNLSGNWLDLNPEYQVADRFVIETLLGKISGISIIYDNQKWSDEYISKLIRFQAGDSPDHVTGDLWLLPEYNWTSNNSAISIGGATTVYPIGELPVYIIPGYVTPLYLGQDNRVKLCCYAEDSENPMILPITVVISFAPQLAMQTEQTYLVPKIITGEGSSPCEFTVDIMAENLGEIRGFEFVLLYDPELVEIVGDNPLQLSSLFSGLSVNTLCNNNPPGVFEYACNTLGEDSVFVVERQSLGQLTFKVLKEGVLEFAFDLNPYSGKTAPEYGRTVLFKLVGQSGNEWFYNPQYSRVVFLYHPADLDQSGKVDLEDLVNIARDFHLTDTDEGWNETYNLYYNYGENVPQIIDVFDLDVVARNYNRDQWDYYPCGEIEGIVTNTNSPLADVRVELWNLNHVEKWTITKPDGSFFLADVPAGVPYTLRVFDSNYQQIGFHENIKVMPEKRLNITLELFIST